MQAAFLDLGTAGAVAQALAAVIPRIAATSGPPQAEAVAVTTMLMELVTVLLSPELCLNPAATPEQRAIDECPSVSEVRFPGSGAHVTWSPSAEVIRQKCGALGPWNTFCSSGTYHVLWSSGASCRAKRYSAGRMGGSFRVTCPKRGDAVCPFDIDLIGSIHRE